jgi:predicted membrane protein
VHEETAQQRESPDKKNLLYSLYNLLENVMHANKRTVSFMGKVALDNKRASESVESLTRVLVVLTVVLVILTVVLVIFTVVLAFR